MMSQSFVSDGDNVLSSKSSPSKSINYEIEMDKLKAEIEKLKAENHVINELLVREKSKSSKYKSEKSELYADYCALREKHFKVFKHVCEVRDGCEYRTYRKDYLKSHMETCRKKRKLSELLDRGNISSTDDETDDE